MCIPDVNKCANDLVSIGCEVEIDIPWTFDEVGLREILIEEWKLMVAKYEKEKESSNHAA